MTRDQIESGAKVHPLEAIGLGRAPYRVFASMRDAQAPDAPEAFARFGLDLVCGCCGKPEATLYVAATEARTRFAICLGCIRWSGDRGMLTGVAREDHEHRRMVDRLTNAKGRR